MILIIDYGMSNLRSVTKAIENLGGQVQVSGSPHLVKKSTKIILPGVASFGHAMLELEKRGFVEPLQEAIAEAKPFLGICLGLQLLFEGSEENPEKKGLGLISGWVRRFPTRKENKLKVPHMGWNQVKIRKPSCPLVQGLEDNSYFYFVHSYYGVPSEKDVILGETEYGLNFASMLWKDNIFACQFHPEKSQSAGLKILENFIRL